MIQPALKNFWNFEEWCYRVFQIKYSPTFSRIILPVSVQKIQVESLKFQDSCSYFLKSLSYVFIRDNQDR